MEYKIKKGDAIHCKTQEEADALFNILSTLREFDDVINIADNWSFLKDNTCFICRLHYNYNDGNGNYHFDYAALAYCIENNIPVVEFSDIREDIKHDVYTVDEGEYEDMPLQDLKAECSERGIKFNNLRNKRYYIELLKEDDEEDGVENEVDDDCIDDKQNYEDMNLHCLKELCKCYEIKLPAKASRYYCIRELKRHDVNYKEDPREEPITKKVPARSTNKELKQETDILKSVIEDLKCEIEQLKTIQKENNEMLMNSKAKRDNLQQGINNYKHKVEEYEDELARVTVENNQLKTVVELHGESLKNLETENSQLKGYLEQYEIDKDKMVAEYEVVINYLMHRMLG